MNQLAVTVDQHCGEHVKVYVIFVVQFFFVLFLRVFLLLLIISISRATRWTRNLGRGR
jgi:hypothetical protein